MKKKILFMMAFALGIQFVSAQAIDGTKILMHFPFDGDLNNPSTAATMVSKTPAVLTDDIDTFTTGKFGQAAKFDNTPYRTTGSTFNAGEDFTMAMWVKFNALANGMKILHQDDSGVANSLAGRPLQLSPDSKFVTVLGEVNTTTSDPNIVGNWTHIAIVMSKTDGTVKFYINGIEDSSKPIANSISVDNKTNTAQFSVGVAKASTTANLLQAELDDLLITSEILTAAQVKSIMNFGVEASKTGVTSVWTGNGDTDTAFGTAANWLPSGAPVANGNIMIPSGLTNYPAASADFTVANIIVEKNASLNAGANSITANTSKVYGGGSLIANSVSGAFTYNVLTAIDNSAPPQIANPEGAGNIFNPAVWNLMSSPVVGETYNNDWILYNFIGTGTGPNRAIASYNNVDGTWSYFQASDTPINFDQGHGFSTRKKTQDYQSNDVEVYEFVGTFPGSDVTLSITQGATNNWNLVGNPFPSYLRVSELLAATNGGGTNADNITTANQTVYVWNGTTYTGLAATDYIQPGQGFFVNADNSIPSNFSIPTSLQSHQTGVTFYKNANAKIALSISDETRTRTTSIDYASNRTLGLDPGNDIGMFTGVSASFAVYTHLVGNDTGIAFERQALPSSDIETIVVPVGVTANAGEEITFSANAENLPADVNVYLEDRLTNAYTLLDDSSNYKLTLDTKQNGVGRFYLHTSASKSLSIDSSLLETVSIYKTSNSNIRIAGLQEGKTSFQLFNILGKQVVKSSFNANGTKDISLPSLASGVYIVKLQTEVGNISKKIILE